MALKSGQRRIYRIIATTNAAAKLKNEVTQAADMIELARPDDIAKLLPAGAVHQGIAALADAVAEVDINDFLVGIESSRKALVVALDQVTDPHNVGAVIRNAAAFGAAGIILTIRHSPGQTASLVKSSAGMVDMLPLVRVSNLANALEKLKKSGFFIIGLAADSKTEISDFDFPDKTAIILGAEESGMRRLTRENCDALLKINMQAGVESLNVSSAAAISLYAAAKKIYPSHS